MNALKQPTPDLPVALTIATSDSGAGAGIQADLLTFAARHVFGVTAQVALTAQNPSGVSSIAQLEPDFIRDQLNQLFAWFHIRAIKTGMLFSKENIELIALYLKTQPDIPLVIDPVMVSTSGAVLLQPDAIHALTEQLFPLATLITPNLDEAATLLGKPIQSREEMHLAGEALARQFNTAFLMKGGHLQDEIQLIDSLHRPGKEPIVFKHDRIPNINTHGSGCTLSAAITAELAKDHYLEAAVSNGITYLETSIKNPLYLNGEAFIAH